MNDWYMMQQLATSSQLMYIQVVTVIGLLVVIAYRPERIRYPVLMRWSYLLLIASILAPPVLNLLIGGLISSAMFPFPSQSYGRGQAGLNSWILQVPQIVGPILLGISLLLAFSSLSLIASETQASRKAAKPVMPQKHPLD